MTPQQTIRNALRGKAVGRILYCPFLDKRWESHRIGTDCLDRFELLKSIGADSLIRGGIRLFFCQHQQVQLIVTQETSMKKCYRYHTPIGDLQYTYCFVPGPNTWFLTERPVKALRDLEVVRYIFDDLTVIPDAEIFEIHAARIGQRGILVPEAGLIRPQCSFQSLLDFWVGTVELSQMLTQAPRKVENALESMLERNLEAVAVTNQTSADAVILFEGSSTTPQMYQEYIQPELKNWANLLHYKGKLLIYHAGSPLEKLLPKIAHSGIDALECVSFRPNDGITIGQMRQALPESITLIGGLDATSIGRMSDSELDQYTRQLLAGMPDAGFILSGAIAGMQGDALSKHILMSHTVSRTGGQHYDPL